MLRLLQKVTEALTPGRIRYKICGVQCKMKMHLYKKVKTPGNNGTAWKLSWGSSEGGSK